jgi:C-terminal processing protease CtpA/Prc
MLLILPGCGLLSSDLPKHAPPLVDLEEPLSLFPEPEDEAARQEMPLGVFTGMEVEDYSESLDALETGESYVRVTKVVENSPADLAGVLEGDLLLSARRGAAGSPKNLNWASEWRAIELKANEGDRIQLQLDRANSVVNAEVVAMKRKRPASRHSVERIKEESKVGIVLRTATEVEARSAGLAPGGGAVVVGLSARSPWRQVGIQFEDLITEVDGQVVHTPHLITQAIADAGAGSSLALTFVRDAEIMRVNAPLSERESELQSFSIPLLFSHEKDRGRSDTSVLFGLFGHESTEAASETTILWLIKFRSGDADRLREVPAQ